MEDFITEERGRQERSPLTGDVSIGLSLPTESKNLNRTSFESFSIFKDATFFDPTSERYCKKGSLFQGPRRFCRLCVFGLLVPVLLISIPLYLRIILYPPTNTPIAPTDQRLISGKTSSFWCQSQTVEMNGSFNAFLLDEPPKLRQQFSTHTMRKHLLLKDDVKEYWGFFLQKGSIIALDLCNRYDGGILMILRGVRNLRKCAWVGEKDSAEEDDDQNEASNEFARTMETPINLSNGLTVQGPEAGLDSYLNMENVPKNVLNSHERKQELDYFIKRILTLGKNSEEIDNRLKMHKGYVKRKKMLVIPDKTSTKLDIAHDAETPMSNIRKAGRERLKRQLSTISENSAVEQMDNLDTETPYTDNSTTEKYNVLRERENALYRQLFHFPKGFVLERGTFFQRENNDSSREEQRSSFSSSEEALLNCDGLLGVVPLHANRGCLGPTSPPSNKITYKIPLTGTYYFVFSSDNEVFDSDLFINMTLKRVVFDTDNPKSSCLNQSTCSLSFSFWSHDQTIVEVPEGDWDSAFIISSKCEPRVAIYVFIILLVPFFILCFAFN